MHYPGLPSHPRYALVQELFSGRGSGGMLAFEVADGPAADAVLRVSVVGWMGRWVGGWLVTLMSEQRTARQTQLLS